MRREPRAPVTPPSRSSATPDGRTGDATAGDRTAGIGTVGVGTAVVGTASGGPGGELSRALRPVTATLLALAGIREGEVVADVRCGPGVLTHAAAAAAGPAGLVYGVDDDPAALAVARVRPDAGVLWVRAGAARLPFRAGAVDKVLLGPAGSDGAARVAVFAECARVLRAGGRLAVGAWGPFGDSAAEDALRRALDAAVPADGDRAGGNPADRDPARGDPADGDRAGGGTGAAGLAALLRAGGLVVVHETGDDVRLRFATSAGYAAWRTSFPDAATGPADGTRDPATSAAGPGAARAALVRRVADLLGAGPVVVPVHVHYATATTPRT